MKFVTLWSVKESVGLAQLAENIGRRAEDEFPPGVNVVGEYWTS
ncbi:MAG: hypothetical protein RRC07_13575 [Anaerolineae bacterium]|nr:hypothetical protein [Anaerolineae bacterium]